MRFVIDGKGYEITREDIQMVTKGVRPKMFDGRNRYFVELHGTRFPIKQPIHLATGLPYTGGFSAQDASRILTKLGYNVHLLEDMEVKETVSRANVYHAEKEGTKKFAVTLEQDEDGFIVASCPALPGCHSQGKTEEEAISNIKEAIRGYVTSMRRHGEQLPDITEVREVEVAV